VQINEFLLRHVAVSCWLMVENKGYRNQTATLDEA